jgi:hypothetical protein
MPDTQTVIQTATTAVPAANVLAALIMGGFLGLLGQGARTIVGLKGLYDEADSRDVSQTDLFSAARLVISLLIGFLAGLAATLALGIDKLLFIDPSKLDILLGIAAAGYVGTDFIEGFMSRFAPTQKPSAPAEKPTESVPEPIDEPLSQFVVKTALRTRGLATKTRRASEIYEGFVSSLGGHDPVSLTDPVGNYIHSHDTVAGIRAWAASLREFSPFNISRRNE